MRPHLKSHIAVPSPLNVRFRGILTREFPAGSPGDKYVESAVERARRLTVLVTGCLASSATRFLPYLLE